MIRFAVLAIALTLTACGGSSSQEPDESELPGQADSGADVGSGGFAASDVVLPCAQGETRSCLGPGACSGAQMCDGLGVWGECDCGVANAGGAGGTGGSGAAATTGGTSGSEPATGDETGGASGTGQAGSDTAGSGSAVGCEPGFLICDGYCTDTRSDVMHCGGCGVECEVVGQHCSYGVCVCNEGLDDDCGPLVNVDLGIDPQTGTYYVQSCRDHMTDLYTCGGCGSCGIDQYCSNGSCQNL